MTLGSWNKDTRVMMISEQLVVDHSWHTVLEVLKHEMAHQLVHECYESDETGHGKNFQKACKHIQVKPLFRSAYCGIKDIDKHLGNSAVYTDPIVARVEKIIQLTHSDNPHEASIAMEKAYALMRRYDLNDSCLQQDNRVRHEVIELHLKRIPREKLKIGTLLTTYFGVELIIATTYDVKLDSEFKTFEVIGENHKVEIALYCFKYLEFQLQHHWQKVQKQLVGDKRGRKTGFCLGILEGVEEKLRQSAEREEGGKQSFQKNSYALKSIGDKEVSFYVQKRYPNLRKNRTRKMRIDAQLYNIGSEIGRDIAFNDAIENQKRKQNKLLAKG